MIFSAAPPIGETACCPASDADLVASDDKDLSFNDDDNARVMAGTPP
jgi:hypothetical protein